MDRIVENNCYSRTSAEASACFDASTELIWFATTRFFTSINSSLMRAATSRNVHELHDKLSPIVDSASNDDRIVDVKITLTTTAGLCVQNMFKTAVN